MGGWGGVTIIKLEPSLLLLNYARHNLGHHGWLRMILIRSSHGGSERVNNGQGQAVFLLCVQ